MNANNIQIAPIFSGRTHKESENISDCQDFFAVNKNCFAIADGASQSFYPSIWAEMLVNNFCQNPEFDKQTWQEWLIPIQNKWLIEVEERVRKAKLENKPIWVTNQNRFSFRESATSTFIGLQFVNNQVRACIVGDSCLFILKNKQLVKSYPIESSKEFSDRPQYFASYAKDNAFTPDFFDAPLNFGGHLHFILATDALSEYIFKSFEQGKDIFKTLLSISSQAEFEDFVAQARGAMDLKMKNDDVTLMILKVLNDSSLNDSDFPRFADSHQNYGVSKSLSRANPDLNTVATVDVERDRLISIKRLNSENAKLANENQSLKRQRFILGFLLATTLLIFFFVTKLFQPESKATQKLCSHTPDGSQFKSVFGYDFYKITKNSCNK